VTYDVVVGVENEDLRLKPGMTANVTITTASRPDALRVPTGALRFRPPAVAGDSGSAAAADAPGERGPRVWVIGADEHPHAVGVTTGIADDRFTEVTGGLREGDRVITALHRSAPPAPPGSAPSFAPARRAH